MFISHPPPLLQVKDVTIESIELSPGSEEIFTFDYKMTKINGSTVSLTADYELKQDLDNAFTGQLVASLITRGNSFFEVYRTKPKGVCELAKSAAAAANMVELPEICPIPQNKGSIEDKLLNFNQVMSAGIPGRVKVEIIIAKDGAEKARITMIVAMK